MKKFMEVLSSLLKAKAHFSRNIRLISDAGLTLVSWKPEYMGVLPTATCEVLEENFGRILGVQLVVVSESEFCEVQFDVSDDSARNSASELSYSRLECSIDHACHDSSPLFKSSSERFACFFS
ncbi:hypothetical protein HUJ04_007843 [Dendroctonus ponderosae]|nr:hypothetical protein HUJ04_007843 [Dendroctonus ponderosae]